METQGNMLDAMQSKELSLKEIFIAEEGRKRLFRKKPKLLHLRLLINSKSAS